MNSLKKIVLISALSGLSLIAANAYPDDATPTPDPALMQTPTPAQYSLEQKEIIKKYKVIEDKIKVIIDKHPELKNSENIVKDLEKYGIDTKKWLALGFDYCCIIHADIYKPILINSLFYFMTDEQKKDYQEAIMKASFN